MSGWTSLIEPLASALGHAVVQSLWQCTLVGAVAAALLLGVRRASVRYGVWFAAMLACIGWFGWTFASGIELPVVGSAGEGGGMIGGATATIDPGGLRLSVFEIVALLWGIGFLLVSIRYLRQWGAAQRLRRREVTEASGEWAAVFEEMRAALGVSRRVRMLVSGIARCPVVVGVVSPVVIVPSSVLLMMSPEQVRMVLAHELAHIRRYDHLVNMLQVLVETVMFYHPVVWWMSHQARVEREHCCDDAAVRWAGDAVSYARALTELEEVRMRTRAVLALQGGSLMNRIRRLIEDTDARRGRGSMRALAVLSAAMLIAGAGYAHAALNKEGPRDETLAAVQSGVSSGVMTQEQARRVYLEVLLPGSELERALAHKQELALRELDAKGASEDEIAQYLNEMRLRAEERIERDFRERVLGMSTREAALSMYGENLARLVEAGEITPAEADALYAEREALLNGSKHMVLEIQLDNGSESAMRAEKAKLELEVRVRAVKELIASGQITKEEGAARLEALKREMGALLHRSHTGGEVIRYEVVPTIKDAQIIMKPEAGSAEEMHFKVLRLIEQEQTGQTFEIHEVLSSEPGQAGAVFELTVTAEPTDAEPESEGFEIRVEPRKTQKKLTPMDEEFWHFQGIRSLSEYEEENPDDC
ncbi:MAG: M56 family metallopeptidase [Phycisphaerales bacterium]|nr:M56 family metallopeptidase [Phycisphaerales bacterium]